MGAVLADVVDVLSVDAEDAVELLLLLLLLDDDDVVVAVEMRVLPSLRAVTSASTSSDFSKNVFVDIPYDSSSCLIAPTRMDFISSSRLVLSVLLNKWKRLRCCLARMFFV